MLLVSLIYHRFFTMLIIVPGPTVRHIGLCTLYEQHVLKVMQSKAIPSMQDSSDMLRLYMYLFKILLIFVLSVVNFISIFEIYYYKV